MTPPREPTAATGPPVDRRATERFTVHPAAACAFAGPAAGDAGPALVLNVSTAGVGLRLARRVEVGAVLSVTLSSRAAGFTKTVQVRVVHVGGGAGGWVVGGAFLTPLTFEEMTALVL